MKRHLNIKPFECNICEMKFTRNSTLKIHKFVHTGERPHKCNFYGCEKRFSEKGNLSTHQKIHVYYLNFYLKIYKFQIFFSKYFIIYNLSLQILFITKYFYLIIS